MTEFKDVPLAVTKEYISTALTRAENSTLSRTTKKLKDLREFGRKLVLDYPDFEDVVLPNLDKYVKIWPKLQFLELFSEFADRLPPDFLALGLPWLKALIIDGELTPQILAMLEATEKLEYLSVEFGKGLLHSIAERFGDSLIYLDIGKFDSGIVQFRAIQYLELGNIGENEFIRLGEAPFLPHLRYFQLSLERTEEEREHGKHLAEEMAAHPEILALRRLNFEPLLSKCQNLHILFVIGAYPQIRSISSLLCEPEICPNLAVLKLFANAWDGMPSGSISGINEIIHRPNLRILNYGRFEWPSEMKELVDRSKLEKYSFNGDNPIPTDDSSYDIYSKFYYSKGEERKIGIKITFQKYSWAEHRATEIIDITDY